MIRTPWCDSCIVSKHRNDPLHGIEKWNGKCFERQDLFALGVKLYLGHGGELCPGTGGEVYDVAEIGIMDVNGIHHVGVVYCCCPQHKTPAMQLLQAGVFPSSMRQPMSGFTFRCLQSFHLMSAVSKMSAYDYARAVWIMTTKLPFAGPSVSSKFMNKSVHKLIVGGRILPIRSSALLDFGVFFMRKERVDKLLVSKNTFRFNRKVPLLYLAWLVPYQE